MRLLIETKKSNYICHIKNTVIFAKKSLFAFIRRSQYLVSIPCAILLVLIRPFFKVRLIGLQAFRIGHYALNTELMLCALDMDDCSKKPPTLFFNMSKPCNKQLYKMWKRTIPIIPFSRLAIQVDFIL